MLQLERNAEILRTHSMTSSYLNNSRFDLSCVCNWSRENVETSSPGTILLIHLAEVGFKGDPLPPVLICPLCGLLWPEADYRPCPDHAGEHLICTACAEMLVSVIE